MRGWKLDLCLSLVGIVGTLVITGFVIADPHGNLVLSSLLAFTLPLAIFPWFEYFVGVGGKEEPTDDGRLDLVASFVSFLFALAASWGVLMSDSQKMVLINGAAHYVAGFHPTQWPIDAFHFVSLSFVSALVSRRSPNGWYDLFGVVLGVLTSALLLLTIKSFTNEWYIGKSWVDRVYAGTTEPFPNVTRVTHAADEPRDMFYGRFACAIGCTAAEFVATLARSLRFSLTRCGNRRADLKWNDLLPCGPKTRSRAFLALAVVSVLFVVVVFVMLLVPSSRHMLQERWSVLNYVFLGILGTVLLLLVFVPMIGTKLPTAEEVNRNLMRLFAWCIVLFLGLQFVLVVVPYPRWVVYDSRHVLLLAALAYFSTPQGEMTKWEGLAAVAALGAGVITSTYATVQTFDSVLVTLAATQSNMDTDAPVHTDMWSYHGYVREFEQGSAAFLSMFQYTQYDHGTVPIWFANTSILTHVVDLVLCGLGSGYLAVYSILWYKTFYAAGEEENTQRGRLCDSLGSRASACFRALDDI